LLSVTWNGVDFTAPEDSLPFSFTALPVVDSISPASGSILGGTVVTVQGSGFLPAGGTYAGGVGFQDIVCSFGPDVPPVPALVLTQGALTCVAPPAAGQQPLPVAVRVSVNGFDFSATAAQFNYLTPAAVTTVLPRTGPEAGGTLVTVIGTGFSNAYPANLLCAFDSVLVPAVWVSDTQLTCVTPAHAPGASLVRVG